MIESIMKTFGILKEFGIIGYLALFLGIGIFITAVWLVKHIVISYERERLQHQQFLSEAVGSNTKMMGVMTERMSDLAGLCSKILENLSRIESADRYQREEHKEIILAIAKKQNR
jgi:hypothetical protein